MSGRLGTRWEPELRNARMEHLKLRVEWILIKWVQFS